MPDDTTAHFYDRFWPKNVPHFEETRRYMFATIAKRSYRNALDAGCGHGICSVVLSEIADMVTAVDISEECVATAAKQALKFGRSNIVCSLDDLQESKLPSAHFDLV